MWLWYLSHQFQWLHPPLGDLVMLFFQEYIDRTFQESFKTIIFMDYTTARIFPSSNLNRINVVATYPGRIRGIKPPVRGLAYHPGWSQNI